MSNGYYLFSCGTVNKSAQSVVAMASYRSDEKLYSTRDGMTKSFKSHNVKPESFILSPKNAPSWTTNRERLWNEVETFEKRDNARLARSILLGLPNDLTNDQQLELTKEYVQETFVDEGMVADVSIHRDDEQNPHAHILLTVREFNEKGEWEKKKSQRVPVLNDKGEQVYDDKGWRKTRSVKLNNWDSKETLLHWRGKWSEKLNEKAKIYDSDKTYSHKSYKDQNKTKKPTHHLTRNAYQLEEKEKNECEKNNKTYTPRTYYAKKNVEIKAYNKKYENVINLEEYKTEKEYKKYLDNVRREHHFDEEKIHATNLLVERAKGYIDYKVALNLYNNFHDERNKWSLKLERDESKINAEKKLYSSLLTAYKNNKNAVVQFGYSSNDFKNEVKADLLKLKNIEEKHTEEKGKFDELKKATEISLDYQKELTNLEFHSIYNRGYAKDYSIEEKYFVLDLLKKHNILIPSNKIKDEYQRQAVSNENISTYVPVWKQAKDTLTSIEIYNRSIRKFNNLNLNIIEPTKLKEETIKINSIKQLKSNYENYIEKIEPLLDQDIREKISPDINCAVIDINVKVALLEGYSKLNEQEKLFLDVNEFIKDIQEQEEFKQQEAANKSNENGNDDEKEIYNNISDRSSNIVDGLTSLLDELQKDNENGNGQSVKRDRTKLRRRRSENGMEL
ncbi:plasmid mobilization system relaxase [Scopulibacillus darangshiensis]|uniref:Plasmid mobilization system relaxase n=1 Tax=Scopulibacillus darangshiensis TaxID=442528 RepID=A0A4R2NRI2_9BACL|nr:MobA/MobL family protein [Scopulibacillus darangshiensis]TCP24460.1 plasmid mobilization system relaxase [Scopulibacillus darangshiensis]